MLATLTRQMYSSVFLSSDCADFPTSNSRYKFHIKKQCYSFFLTDAEEAYELTTQENDDLQDRQ